MTFPQKKGPRVSIGLPVYNGQDYLAQGIEAQLSQTFGDFELIISDNASDDATEEICRQYVAEDPRIRYVRWGRNRGAAWNFNQTFQMGRGPYFRWAAHDDLCAPDYLEQCVDVLDRDASVVLCFPRAAVIDHEGRIVAEPSGYSARGRDDEALTDDSTVGRRAALESARPHRRLYGVLVLSARCYEVFGLMRSAAMRKTRRHGTYVGGEKVFLAELSLVGPFRLLPEVGFFSRWHAARFSAHESVTEQVQHMNSTPAPGFCPPRQVRCSWEYFRSILRAELPIRERARCVHVFGQYLLQWHKWKRVAEDAVHGTDTKLCVSAHARRMTLPADACRPAPELAERLTQMATSLRNETVGGYVGKHP